MRQSKSFVCSQIKVGIFAPTAFLVDRLPSVESSFSSKSRRLFHSPHSLSLDEQRTRHPSEPWRTILPNHKKLNTRLRSITTATVEILERRNSAWYVFVSYNPDLRDLRLTYAYVSSQAIRDLGFSIKGDELQDYFKIAGVDIGGDMTLNQFYAVMAEKLKRADNPDDIIAAFKGFDPDADHMSEARFKLIMTKMGAKLNEEEIGELLKEVSVGGKVKFDKLKEVVLG